MFSRTHRLLIITTRTTTASPLRKTLIRHQTTIKSAPPSSSSSSSPPSHQNHPRSYQTSPLNLFAKSDQPGSLAFAASETEAVYDLFHHHVKKSGGYDEEGAYICILGVKELLSGIGERADDETLRRIFEEGDVNGDGKLHLTEFLTVADKVLGETPARFVFVIGGPGSGKGLLCSRLVKECGCGHISSGDLLRKEVALGTPLGQEAKSIMDQGGLIPSDIITALLRRRMRSYPGQRVLLDGFPRSTENATDFAEVCGKPEMALFLDCDDTTLMERIIKRGADAVNGDAQRSDDNIDTALERIRNYHKYQRPVMDWLRDEHVPIVRLDVSGSPETVWDQLVSIGRLMRPIARIPNQLVTSLF